MKAFLLAAIVLAIANPLLAQTGSVQLYASADGPGCAIQDVRGIVEVHVVYVGADGLAGIVFGAAVPECWTGATWIADDFPWTLKIGDTQMNDPRGLSIALTADHRCNGGGPNAPVYLGKIIVNATGQAGSCCEMSVVRPPATLYPELDGPHVVLCDESSPYGLTDELLAGAGTAMINAGPGCPCSGALPVAVEETTWGKLKSLYSE